MATWEEPFKDIDPLSLYEIIRIQLEDSDEFAASDKGKQREGTSNDAQIALRMFQEDLRSCDATLQDRRLAQSIATAVLQDGDLIYQAYRQEQQVQKDRDIAVKLEQSSRSNVAPAADNTGTGTGTGDDADHMDEIDPWTDEEMLAKVAALYMQPKHERKVAGLKSFGHDEHVVAESSSRAAHREQQQVPLTASCVACSEDFDFFDVARVPCDHEYCRECLAELFTLSMKDESLFPPRCCRSTIPLSRVKFFLPKDVSAEFESKAVELGTKNRVYCHSSTCSTFIPPNRIDKNTDIGTCPVCEKTTCTICKQVAHSGDCPEDTALQQLIEYANEKQWQRCYQCNAFVELDTGCNHMTCRFCKAQFCYVCGSPWKTCHCEQWVEQRLIARATEIVDRDPNQRVYQPRRQPRTQPATPRRMSSATRLPQAERPTTSAFGEVQIQARQSQAVESEWESDFSEHSTWEEDWESDAESPVQPQSPSSEPSSPRIDTAVLEEVDPDYETAAFSRRRRIAEAIENLRANHECSHRRWSYVRGSHQCEECMDWLPKYIFDCAQCHLRACNRCRRNRL